MIVYANAGAGHRRAAEALHQEVQLGYPDAAIEIFDALQYTTPFFEKNYSWLYLFLVKYLPGLWGLGFYFLNLSWVDRITKKIRRINNLIACQRLETYLQTVEPNLVFTTHFLPNEVISHLKRKHGFETRLITCITDYYPHIWWRDSGVDLYIAPNEDVVPRLVKLGISPTKIQAFGIPIGCEFKKRNSKEQDCAKLGVKPGRFTLLVTSGGFGVGPLQALVEEIVKLEIPLQILVVCGNNPKLQEDLQKLTNNPLHSIKIYGFVRNMHELMAVSDLMVSKSGGLTTTEAMAKALPMIVLYPIPGQESSNCRFLLNHQAGLRAANPKEAASQIADLVENPERLQKMKENMAKMGNPEAACEIVAYVKKVYQIKENREWSLNR